jgi:hypothetical protein
MDERKGLQLVNTGQKIELFDKIYPEEVKITNMHERIQIAEFITRKFPQINAGTRVFPTTYHSITLEIPQLRNISEVNVARWRRKEGIWPAIQRRFSRNRHDGWEKYYVPSPLPTGKITYKFKQYGLEIDLGFSHSMTVYFTGIYVPLDDTLYFNTTSTMIHYD